MVVGGYPPIALLQANLKWSPAVPWFLPVTVVWLVVCWQYLQGKGPPRETSEARRRALRAAPVSAGTWIWALLAGGAALVGTFGVGLFTFAVTGIDPSAFQPGIDLARYPWWTGVSLLLAISLVAGVTGEAAFRGYVISAIQQPYGWPAAIVVSGLLFFTAHVLSHSEITLAFLPYFMLGSVVYGLLVFLTGSIWPCVVLHVLMDAIGLPVLFVVHPTVTSSLAVIAVGMLAAVPAFWCLAAVGRPFHRRRGAALTRRGVL